MTFSKLILVAVPAALAAGTVAGAQELSPPRIVSFAQTGPTGVGQAAELRIGVRAAAGRVTRLFVAFGDGTSTTVIRDCREARRNPVFTVRHRYRTAGDRTVRARATVQTCGSDDIRALRSAPRELELTVHPARVSVPKLRGRRMSHAECLLAARGLRWRYPGMQGSRWRPNTGCRKGDRVQPDPLIERQSPVAGARVAAASVVTLEHDCRGNCG